MPTARSLSAAAVSHAEISVKWEIPWDPDNVVTGYVLTWKVTEDEKGNNILNAPTQSVMMSSKETSRVLRDLSK